MWLKRLVCVLDGRRENRDATSGKKKTSSTIERVEPVDVRNAPPMGVLKVIRIVIQIAISYGRHEFYPGKNDMDRNTNQNWLVSRLNQDSTRRETTYATPMQDRAALGTSGPLSLIPFYTTNSLFFFIKKKTNRQDICILY